MKGAPVASHATEGHLKLQVQLFEGSIGGPGTADDEIYLAAVANLAVGLKTYTPANLKTAILLLRKVNDKTEPTTGRSSFALQCSQGSSAPCIQASASHPDRAQSCFLSAALRRLQIHDSVQHTCSNSAQH